MGSFSPQVSLGTHKTPSTHQHEQIRLVYFGCCRPRQRGLRHLYLHHRCCHYCRNRGKRSAENDYAFIALNNAEPAQCYKRLICDLATGAIPDSDNILSLFNEDTEVISPKFEYTTAAKLVKAVKNAQVCEVRYSCPLNNQEIAKIFA